MNRLLPIQRAYLEALNYARVEPELGQAKLKAMIDLYDNRQSPEDPLRLEPPQWKYLELARRRLKELSRTFEMSAAQDLHLLQGQLNRADDLEAEDPERAKKMREAVLTLYGNKPWAAPAAERARKALDRETPASPPEPATE